jgi:hypothetical protein
LRSAQECFGVVGDDERQHCVGDADRDISAQWPEEGVEMDVETLLRAKGVEPDEND